MNSYHCEQRKTFSRLTAVAEELDMVTHVDKERREAVGVLPFHAALLAEARHAFFRPRDARLRFAPARRRVELGRRPRGDARGGEGGGGGGERRWTEVGLRPREGPRGDVEKATARGGSGALREERTEKAGREASCPPCVSPAEILRCKPRRSCDCAARGPRRCCRRSR